MDMGHHAFDQRDDLDPIPVPVEDPIESEDTIERVTPLAERGHLRLRGKGEFAWTLRAA
jgi:hypothetical protein